MKNFKKNVFGMGLALSMMLGMVFALVPQEARASRALGVTCYSASAGQEKGAGFYLCTSSGTCPWQQDLKKDGSGSVCYNSTGSPGEQ